MAEPDDNFFSRWSRRKVLVREGVPVAAAPEPAPPVAAPAAGTVALAKPSLGTVAAGTAATSETATAATAATAANAAEAAAAANTPQAPPTPPLPTLADVAELTTDSDYARFVAQGVSPEVKNAALKKLFTDPQFNVMDGLDIYIDDYGKPDPLPEGMLRKMVQSKMLRLFDDDPEEAPAAATAAPEPQAADSGATDPHTTPHTAPDTALPEPSPPNEDLAVQLQPDPAAGRPGLEPGAGQDAGRQH